MAAGSFHRSEHGCQAATWVAPKKAGLLCLEVQCLRIHVQGGAVGTRGTSVSSESAVNLRDLAKALLLVTASQPS